MQLVWCPVTLAAAIAAHWLLLRYASRVNSVLLFLAPGCIAGAALSIFVLLTDGLSTTSAATIAAYAFCCELYLFLFTMATTSISVQLLLLLRRSPLKRQEIEQRYSGRTMADLRLGRLVFTGLLDVVDGQHRPTAKGRRFAHCFFVLRSFFRGSADAATTTEANTEQDAPIARGRIATTVVGAFSAARAGIRQRLPDLAMLALLALAAVFLFRRHLTEQDVYLGNSDRINHSLTILKFFTDQLREGRLDAWDDSMFTGFDAFAVPWTFPNPVTLFCSLFDEQRLFYVAGAMCCLLLAAAGWAAYAFIRDVTGHPFTSLVGAVMYEFSSLTTLKISQNDMSFLALLLVPILLLVLRRIRSGVLLRTFILLSLALTALLMFSFIQKAAYVILLCMAYAAFLSATRKSWRPAIVLGAALLVAGTVALPRIYTIYQELSVMRRGEPKLPFDLVYAGQNIRPHHVLRWLDDGVFGQFPSQSLLIGNQINLSEGMLLYTSVFAVLVLGLGVLRYRGEWFRLLRSPRDEPTFFFWVLAAVLLVILVKPVNHLVFLAFTSKYLFHARILLVGLLPLCTLVSLILTNLLEIRAIGAATRRFGWQLLAVFSTILVLVLMHQAGRSTSSNSAFELWLPYGAETSGDPTYRAVVPKQVLLRIAVAAMAFTIITCLIFWRRTSLPWRYATIVTLGLLIVTDTVERANFRVNGSQNRSDVPFLCGNFYAAPAGRFTPPSNSAQRAVAQALDTERYRAITVRDPTLIPPFCSPHIAHFWKLRLADGYLSGVPAGLAELPWPGEVCGMRELTFTDPESLPWPVLSLLNVKHAVLVNPEFYSNCVVDSDGKYREAGPGDFQVLENPLGVVPREFFVSRVESVASPADAASRMFAKAGVPDVQTVSFSEGDAVAGDYACSGSITARYQGSRIEIDLDPSPERRFLVLNERYHPGWRAFAQTHELEVQRTNGYMRGLVVPPGVAHVSLSYTPFAASRFACGFYAAALLTLGLGGCLFALADRRRRRVMEDVVATEFDAPQRLAA